jgi:hypothetical protein
MDIVNNINVKQYDGCLLEFLEVQQGDKIQLNQIKFIDSDTQKAIKIKDIQINCKKCESFGNTQEIYTHLLTNNDNNKWCSCLSYFPNNIIKIIFLFDNEVNFYENKIELVIKSANDFSHRDPKVFKLYGLKLDKYVLNNDDCDDEVCSNSYTSIMNSASNKELIHSWNNIVKHSNRNQEKSYKLYDINNRVIPKNIFQTHKSLEYINNKKNVKAGMKSWKVGTDYNYYFYSDDDCNKFMQQNFDKKTNEAFNKCPIPVMKADMWRYCVIYVHGGIYADSDTILEVPANFLTDLTTQLAITTENDTHFCQWVFSAPPLSPILKEIIDLSVKRVLDCRDFKRKHIIHETTGPAVFTDGIFLYLIKNNKQLANKNDNKFKYKLNDEQTDFDEIGIRKCNDYVNYCDEDLVVFNPKEFHYEKVTHFFTGQSTDGWCNQRKKMIENNEL